jgi:hypothetical protein
MILFTALLAVVCADVFVFTHLDHDHAEDQCAVCSQIETARGFIAALGCAAAAACIGNLASIAAGSLKNAPVFCLSPVTLFSLKTRLNS